MRKPWWERTKELRESLENLRVLMESLPLGVILIDAERHVIEDVNAEAARLIGASVDEIIGRRCHQYVCPAEEGNCPITDLEMEIETSDRFLINADGEQIPISKRSRN